MKLTVPALARGLVILRLFEDGSRHTLEDVIKHTGFPKASVFRMCSTMTAMNLLERDSRTKTYRARARLTFMDHGDEDFERSIDESLVRLAEQTGHTVEWYVPSEAGMLIVKRQEPSQGEVRVRVRIGFLCEWEGELNAVMRVGRAFWPKAPRDCESLWTYRPNWTSVPLTEKEAEAWVDETRKERCAIDLYYNMNAVKRMACPVFNKGAFAGALALALCFKPEAEDRISSAVESLKTEAQMLSLGKSESREGIEETGE